MDKMEHESEERLVVALPASCRNSLVGGSSSECQTLARDDLAPEIAASFSQNTFLGSSLRISGLPQVLPDKF